ncbi:hypothetical protein KY346_06125 [Candidatus Woesearchaeota archaeon]|nr:hypothetical protein [Candidatus Woesearchaeota archaeon]
MTGYSVEIAKEILARFQSKGWSIYAAQYSDDEIDFNKTIKAGPVQELQKDILYVILPDTDKPSNPGRVKAELRSLVDKLKEKKPASDKSLGPLLPLGEGGVELQGIILRKNDIAIPGKGARLLGALYSTFIESLKKFYNRHKERQINYTNIDSLVRDLIYTLNKIPFLRTVKSRAGYLKEKTTTIMGSVYPDKEDEKGDEYCFVSGGHVLFDIVDIFDSNARLFLDDVKKLVADYPFASLDEEDGHKKITLSVADLTRADEVKEDDDLVTKIKKEQQTKKHLAQTRMEQFRAFKDGLAEIAKKYVE